MNKKRQNQGLCSLVLLTFLLSCTTAEKSPEISVATQDVTEKLTREILVNGQAFSNLKELVSGGSRISGSESAAHAVQWAKAKMESYGFDKVWLQDVIVPHWVRGHHEDAILTSGGQGHLKVAALGNSIGTTEKGVEAEVVEVKSLKEATEKASTLNGKIVFFNGPMDPTLMDTFHAYGQSVPQRGRGAALVAGYGAVAVLVRSMTLNHDLHPHTGGTDYKDASKKIPAATIATADADRLSEILKTQKARVKLFLSAQPMDPVHSFNVIGEMTGSEFPNEYIVVGGHLDSWDLGPGAQDDGAGAVQSIEVLRAMKALHIQPKRTVRAVLFMTEEFGGIGADEYAKQAVLKKEKHIAALESDRGGFTPRGFSTNANETVFKKLNSWKPYLAPLNADKIISGEGGTDVDPLAATGTVLFGLYPDSARYFDYHHAETDTLEAVNPRELHLGASAMAILIYLISNQGL
jgi:hypothetical protein